LSGGEHRQQAKEIAEEVANNYWKLIIKTVFRESDEHRLKTGVDQLVYEK
jgi:hypothetical protein